MQPPEIPLRTPVPVGVAVESAVAVQEAVQARRSAAEFTEWLTRLGFEWSVKLLAVMLLLTIAWILGMWARRSIGRMLARSKIDQTFGRFVGNAVRWIILVIAIIACLGFFGFNITSMAALVGAAGLTVGLAMQGSLSNLAAGLMLMVIRPFKIGDVVQLAGQIGKVNDIDLFNTKIDTGDNRRLIIPNGQIFGSTIENITHHPVRRCDLNVGAAYAADLRLTREALRRAALGVARRVPDRPVDVVLQNLGSNAVEWTVRVWVPTTDFLACKDELVGRIKDELDAAGIPIPFPQMDVWLRSALNSAAIREAPARPDFPDGH